MFLRIHIFLMLVILTENSVGGVHKITLGLKAKFRFKQSQGIEVEQM